MDNLILKGLLEIENMKFHHIEGGFGKDKRAMLVKDIAEIHRRDLKDVNRNINNNIKRFKNEVDILDLKVGELKSLSLELGYSNQSYANANNIYVLSERGYSKLLKILEDDFAWEQYEKLVDGYFNMRQAIKEVPATIEDMMILQLQEQKKLKSRVETIEGKLESLEVNPSQKKAIQNLKHKRIVELLGGRKTNAYMDRSFRGRVYSDLGRDYLNYFDIPSYELTPKNRFDEALEVIKSYNLSTELTMELKKINNNITFY